MPKPPTKGVTDGVTQPKPAAPRVTRAGMLAAGNTKSSAPPNGAKDKPSKERQGDQTLAESYDMVTPVPHKVISPALGS